MRVPVVQPPKAATRKTAVASEAHTGAATAKESKGKNR